MKNVLEDLIEVPQDRRIVNRNIDYRTRDIPGWGMDADPENDPTYPMKHANGADHDRLILHGLRKLTNEIRHFRGLQERIDLTGYIKNTDF